MKKLLSFIAISMLFCSTAFAETAADCKTNQSFNTHVSKCVDKVIKSGNGQIPSDPCTTDRSMLPPQTGEDALKPFPSMKAVIFK